MSKEITCFADLSEEEADLIAKHMEENPNVRFDVPFEGWYVSSKT